MAASSHKIHQITVPPLDGKREFLGLIGAITAICLLVGLRLFLLPETSTLLLQQPYHRLDTTLNSKERLMYQNLLAATAEVLYLWRQGAQWPNTELLAEEGVPPFATDMVPPGLSNYTWKTHDRGPWVDYLGHDQSENQDEPSVLLRIIDLHADFHPHPHPGKDYDPNKKAAVQIWMHPLNKQKYAGMQLFERGWSWIISPKDPLLSTPSESLKEEQ